MRRPVDSAPKADTAVKKRQRGQAAPVAGEGQPAPLKQSLPAVMAEPDPAVAVKPRRKPLPSPQATDVAQVSASAATPLSQPAAKRAIRPKVVPLAVDQAVDKAVVQEQPAQQTAVKPPKLAALKTPKPAGAAPQKLVATNSSQSVAKKDKAAKAKQASQAQPPEPAVTAPTPAAKPVSKAKSAKDAKEAKEAMPAAFRKAKPSVSNDPAKPAPAKNPKPTAKKRQKATVPTVRAKSKVGEAAAAVPATVEAAPPLQPDVACPSCERQLPAWAKFCRACGASQAAVRAVVSQELSSEASALSAEPVLLKAPTAMRAVEKPQALLPVPPAGEHKLVRSVAAVVASGEPTVTATATAVPEPDAAPQAATKAASDSAPEPAPEPSLSIGSETVHAAVPSVASSSADVVTPDAEQPRSAAVQTALPDAQATDQPKPELPASPLLRPHRRAIEKVRRTFEALQLPWLKVPFLRRPGASAASSPSKTGWSAWRSRLTERLRQSDAQPVWPLALQKALQQTLQKLLRRQAKPVVTVAAASPAGSAAAGSAVRTSVSRIDPAAAPEPNAAPAAAPAIVFTSAAAAQSHVQQAVWLPAAKPLNAAPLSAAANPVSEPTLERLHQVLATNKDVRKKIDKLMPRHGG